jgi:hypothetical protein
MNEKSPLRNEALVEASFPKTLEFYPMREYNESLQLTFLDSEL